MIIAILNIVAAAAVIAISYTAVSLDPRISAEDAIKAMTETKK